MNTSKFIAIAQMWKPHGYEVRRLLLTTGKERVMCSEQVAARDPCREGDLVRKGSRPADPLVPGEPPSELSRRVALNSPQVSL